MFRDLVLRNRSYRRFYESEAIAPEVLRELVDLARLTPSSGNLQPFKYWVSCEPERNALVFPHLGWAGYLSDWPGPEAGERPSAYIVVLGDRNLARAFAGDAGIVSQTMMLGAAERSLGGCIIGNIKREALMAALNLDPERYELVYVLALGRPKESVVLEPMGPEQDVKYYRDETQTHHVPKRALDDLLL